MKYEIFLNMPTRVLQELGNLTTLFCAVDDYLPTVDHQPEIFMPTYAKTQEGEFVKGCTSFLGEENDRFFSMDFSLDYHNSGKNNHEIISQEYCLDEVEVSLVKFMKKASNIEEGVEDYIKPHAIFYSTDLYTDKDISLHILNKTFDEQEGNLAPGCQYITLMFGEEIDTPDKLKQYLKNLRNIFLQEDEIPKNHGFKFRVTIPKRLSPGRHEIIVLYTNMFALNFADDGYIVKVEHGEQTGYHL